MIWIILGLAVILIGLYLASSTNGESLTGLIFVFVFFIPIFSGISTYYGLVGEREQIVTLQREMETMRGAHYPVESGTLVGGSLDNMEQSTILSEYIENYVKKKAHYNQKLKEAQIKKKMAMCYWFMDSAFVSDKVFKLELLK